MRPYRRKHHSSWRTRRRSGIVSEACEFLQPFISCTKSIWRLDPPFPLTAKIFITGMTWVLLFLPLCYFLVPPLAALFLLNYFSERISLDSFLARLGDFCAGAAWPGKAALPLKFVKKISIFFFLYDYYQILKCLRSE